MTAMSTAQIATLNRDYAAALAAKPDQSTHTLTHDVAMSWGLEVLCEDDESGVLYRNSNGEYVYGWQSGGFDNQIGA